MKYINKTKKLASLFQRLCQKLYENNVVVYASSAAFYFFFSIIPLLIIMCFFLPYTIVDMSDLKSMVYKVTPEGVSGFTDAIITELSAQSIGHMSFVIIVILWSASRGIVALSNGLNNIYDVKRKPGIVSYILFQIKSMFYTILFVLLIIAWLLIITVSKEMHAFVIQWLPKVASFFEFWLRKGHVVSLLTMMCLIFLMYVMLPEKNIHTARKEGCLSLFLIARLLGAVVASFLWTALAILFSWWVHNYASFSIYGSLATIVFSLYWIFMGMMIIMIGAQLSHSCRGFLSRIRKKNGAA